MIDVLKQELTPGMSNLERLNRTREFLQILCLKLMCDQNCFDHLAFLGGTSLRVLFGLKRFSEDLDFSLAQKTKYDFSKVTDGLLRGFKLYGFAVDIKVKEEKTVQNALLRFSGLLKEVGLSALEAQKLTIKMEVDTNPPQGAQLAHTIVHQKTYMLNLAHYDMPSLYAGKLHACFFRKFIKGRDFYDFVWYLSRRVTPNFLLLNNAIRQTQGLDLKIDDQNFKSFLLERIERIDFEEVKKDVERFLEDKNELKLLELKPIQNTIESVY